MRFNARTLAMVGANGFLELSVKTILVWAVYRSAYSLLAGTIIIYACSTIGSYLSSFLTQNLERRLRLRITVLILGGALAGSFLWFHMDIWVFGFLTFYYELLNRGIGLLWGSLVPDIVGNAREVLSKVNASVQLARRIGTLASPFVAVALIPIHAIAPWLFIATLSLSGFLFMRLLPQDITSRSATSRLLTRVHWNTHKRLPIFWTNLLLGFATGVMNADIANVAIRTAHFTSIDYALTVFVATTAILIITQFRSRFQFGHVVIGLASLACGLVLIALWHNFAGVLIGRFIIGLGAGLYSLSKWITIQSTAKDRLMTASFLNATEDLAIMVGLGFLLLCYGLGLSQIQGLFVAAGALLLASAIAASPVQQMLFRTSQKSLIIHASVEGDRS